jgi:hypothetical protein
MTLIATWFSEGRRAQHPPPFRAIRWAYADGGFSGSNMERPALQGLLADIRAGRIDIVVIYKVDRVTRSLASFARLLEIFDAQDAAFVSVTQQFNTTSSMGRLTLDRPHMIDFIEVSYFPPKEAQTAHCVSRRQLGGMGAKGGGPAMNDHVEATITHTRWRAMKSDRSRLATC